MSPQMILLVNVDCLLGETVFSKILVAVDGSETANNALDVGLIWLKSILLS